MEKFGWNPNRARERASCSHFLWHQHAEDPCSESGYEPTQKHELGLKSPRRSQSLCSLFHKPQTLRNNLQIKFKLSVMHVYHACGAL